MYREGKERHELPPMNALAKSEMLVCRQCNLEAEHNNVLRLSYCPVHGLASPLDSKATLALISARTRVNAFSFHSSKAGW